MAKRFTEKQGQYLAFIDNYTVMFGRAPSEADLQRFVGSSSPYMRDHIRRFGHYLLDMEDFPPPLALRTLRILAEMPA